jgi:hypothetical protein
MKQEWRVKGKANAPWPTTSDDDMDLLDDDESLFIKDGSPPPTDMDINMVFMLPAEFNGAEEEVTQMCLSPKEVLQWAPWSPLNSATTFVVKVQGNYSVILGHDWIHANHCFPSTLHQFLIKFIDDEIKVVHVDASAYIGLADATTDWQHGSTQCLSGKDLIGYDFLSVSKEGFVPMSVKLASEARFSNIVFQWVRRRMSSGYDIA